MTMSSKIVFDIEADGLNPTQIWCVCAKHLNDNEVYTFTDKDTFNEFLSHVSQVVGHNIIGYDIPVLERLWGSDFSNIKVVDTLVMSRLSEPSKLGGHSLKKWGEYLKYPKDTYDDWSRLTPEMVDYCKQDVRVTQAVYNMVLKDLNGFSDVAVELEHEVLGILNKQQLNGWLVNEREANLLHSELCEKKK